MDKDIHAIQASILKELLLRKTGRFSELNVDKISTDHFTFHLKQLVDQGIVEKTEDGSYKLTTGGKEYANRFDVDSSQIRIEKQAKIGVLVIAVRNKNGATSYLMQERLKHPFFGYRGFITGKVKFGETIMEAAAREFKEEAGLSGRIEPKAVYHERIFSPSNDLYEDKNFFVFKLEDPEGELVERFQGGQNRWIDEDSVLDGNVFYDIADLLKLAAADGFTFAEKSYIVPEY